MLVLELGRKAVVSQVAFAPNGRALAAASDAGMYLWDDIAGRARADLWLGIRYAGSAGFTADGRWLFAGAAELNRIDVQTGTSMPFPLWGGFNIKFDVSPAGPLVLATQHLYADGAYTARLGLWRTDDPTPDGKVWERPLAEFNYYPPQFRSGGDRFARIEYGSDRPGGPARYRVVVHETATGTPVAAYPVAVRAAPYQWLLGPDDNLFVVQNANLIDLHHLDAPDAPLVLIRNDSRRHFTGIALHPTGRLLAAASNDHTVKLYDATTGDAVRAFTWQLGRMRSICFSPDGTLAAAGSDKGQVVVWDVDA